MYSHKFESLDEDLEELLDKVSKRMEMGISSRHCEEERKRILLQLDCSLEEAKNILTRMETEARQVPSKDHTKMKSKVHKYNEEIQRHRKWINQLRYPDFSNAETVPSMYSTATSIENDIRKQVLIGAASLERASDSLARSHAVAIETEQIGTEVLGDLETQREALQRTRDRLVDTQGEISRSKKLIRAIGSNVFYNKILLILIIVLEVLILACLCYWKFFT